MSELPAWRLWLDDHRAARVRRSLDTLGAALLAVPSEQIPSPPGLTAGLSGVALAHAYLARAGLGDAHEERCGALLAESVDDAATLAGDCSMARGLAGFAFVLEHLGANDEEDGCAEVDDIIAAELQKHDELPVELMWGVAGRAICARERLPRPSARALYDALQTRLLEKARPQADSGLAWFADPDPRFADSPMNKAYPDGGFNLGVAHGNPGIIAVLAAGDDARARDAALAGMRWLWSQRFESGDAAFAIMAGSEPYTTHGWCYGDEGVGAVGYAAARALGDQGWQSRWLEILRRCVGRAPMTERGLTLCHGTAGTMHVWHRIYQSTGDAQFREATLAWLDATLDGLQRESVEYVGLLDGSAGVALALAALVSDVEPAWDRLFALSHRALG